MLPESDRRFGAGPMEDSVRGLNARNIDIRLIGDTLPPESD